MATETPAVAALAASELELYKLARAQIEHENTLVGQRISWYLTFQGLLFTALFLLATSLFDPAKKDMPAAARTAFTVAVLLLGVVGALSSLACFGLGRAAYAQIGAVAAWWQRQLVWNLPPPSGTGGWTVLGYHVTGADFVPVLFAVWITFIGLLVHAAL